MTLDCKQLVTMIEIAVPLLGIGCAIFAAYLYGYEKGKKS